MAAIAYPEFRPQSAPPRHLRLVPPPQPAHRGLSRPTMYRRRRVAVVVALFLAVFFLVLAARAALGALGGGPLAAPEAPAVGAGGAAVYVVQPGDTYWSIARSLQPSGDVRALVDQLSATHHGAPLQPGEQLALN
jgi:hypothetical protein